MKTSSIWQRCAITLLLSVGVTCVMAIPTSEGNWVAMFLLSKVIGAIFFYMLYLFIKKSEKNGRE